MFKIKRIYYNQLALYLLYHYLARSFGAIFPCLIGRVARYTHSSDMKKHHQNNVQYNNN